MTVEELLDRISSVEIVQWQALYEIEKEEEEFDRQQRAMVNSFR
jgi:hypothetical protein